MAMRDSCFSFFLEMPVCRSASASLSSSLSSAAAGFSSSCTCQNDQKSHPPLLHRALLHGRSQAVCSSPPTSHLCQHIRQQQAAVWDKSVHRLGPMQRAHLDLVARLCVLVVAERRGASDLLRRRKFVEDALEICVRVTRLLRWQQAHG